MCLLVTRLKNGGTHYQCCGCGLSEGEPIAKSCPKRKRHLVPPIEFVVQPTKDPA